MLERWRAGRHSLRRRLLVSVLGANAVLWLVSLGIVLSVAWHESSELFDEAMEESAQMALLLARDLPAPPHAASAGEDEDAPGQRLKMYYQLVAPDGRLLRRAEDAPQQPFVRDFARRSGHVNAWVDGHYWRVHVRRAPDGALQAQVGQRWEERLDLLSDMVEKLAWPALALQLVLGALCWWLIRRQLAPLERTAAAIAAKSPQDLSPVAGTDPPAELRPIVEALDALLARLSHALDAERRFTSDAAHELRTPLAALRMRVQLIERQQRVPLADLQQLRADVDRCTALVESLLVLARLDPERGMLQRQAVDLPTLFAGLDLGAAQARGMQVERDARASVLQAEPALLASALRGLLDNAVRYGRAGGRVQIVAEPRAGGGVRIAVRDDGPGVPPAERARLGERFFRVLGSGVAGNGLGLSIVARIAALHGATLHFEDGLDGRGLGAVLDFPPG